MRITSNFERRILDKLTVVAFQFFLKPIPTGRTIDDVPLSARVCDSDSSTQGVEWAAQIADCTSALTCGQGTSLEEDCTG
jgi:hypothetical protein